MAATSPRSATTPTIFDIDTDIDVDTASPSPRRAGTLLLRVLEELGSQPSVWDPWLLLTPYRAVERTVARR